MRTQRGDLLGLFPDAFPKGILKGGAEIEDPNRKLGLGDMEDVVCVRFGGSSGWPNVSTVRAYVFNGARLNTNSGYAINQAGVLIQTAICGWNPTFRPFPEAEFQPKP
jgi:hypothetical protein